jgi:outer membrane receptor protein involved in Fe transport
LYHLTTKDSGDSKGVDPETSDTFEIGYKGNFESITFDAAVYLMDVDDGIVNVYDDELGLRYLTNATRVIHKGIELSTLWAISEEVNVSLAYSRSKHEFDEDENYAGNEMRMAPDYIANVRLRYTPSYLEGFSSQLELQSIGEYWMDDANSTDPDTGLERKEDGYSIVNLKARYQVNYQLSFNARVLNLTDKIYVQGAEYRYGRNSWSPGAPRTAYIGMSYQW